MKTFPDLIVCEHCDSVYRRRPLGHREVARCVRCGAVLWRGTRVDLDGWLALTVAAAIAFVLANLYPVIEIRFQGLHNQASLWQAVAALAQGGAAPVAVVAAVTAIAVPLAQILLLLWVLGFARAGLHAPGLREALRALRLLHPWSMVEVSLLAALVAIVKLSDLLEVVPGIGVWAMAVLTLLVTVVANRDPQLLWRRLDEVRG